MQKNAGTPHPAPVPINVNKWVLGDCELLVVAARACESICALDCVVAALVCVAVGALACALVCVAVGALACALVCVVVSNFSAAAFSLFMLALFSMACSFIAMRLIFTCFSL